MGDRSRRAWRPAAIVVLAAGALAGTGTSAAALAPTTFTWSGADAGAPNVDPNWSDGANWVGGVAPSAPGPVDLVFPPLAACTPMPNCARSTNDLSGLTVSSLSVTTAGVPLALGGDAITATGLFTFAGPATVTYGIDTTLAGSAAQWSLAGGHVVLGDRLHGSGPFILTVGASSTMRVAAVDHPFSVGSLAITGADPVVAPAANGTVDLGGADDHVATTATNAAIAATGGGFVGPLTTNRSDITLAPGVTQLGGQAAPVFLSQGAAALDPATTLHLVTTAVQEPLNQVAIVVPQLAATSSLDLRSATLAISTAQQCAPLGSVYAVAAAPAGQLLGSFTRAAPTGPVPIGNGTVVTASPAHTPACAAGSTSSFRIEYDRAHGVVNATAVVPALATAAIATPSGLASRSETFQGAAADIGGPGVQAVLLYYRSLIDSTAGVLVASCGGCGPEAVATAWSAPLPPGFPAGVYSFVAQAIDTAGTFGPGSNVVYQIVT